MSLMVDYGLNVERSRRREDKQGDQKNFLLFVGRVSWHMRLHTEREIEIGGGAVDIRSTVEYSLMSLMVDYGLNVERSRRRDLQGK